MAYWTTVPADLDEGAARARVAAWIDRRDEGRGALWVIEREGNACGQAGLVISPPAAIEVFYAVLPSARGAGVAGRTAALIAGWARRAGYRQIGLATFPDNVASERTAERAGFVRTGTTERRIKDRAHTLTTWVYAPAKRPVDGRSSHSG